ncbi:MAG: STAS domain-containing protein, partial [Gemmataceae bacterium]
MAEPTGLFEWEDIGGVAVVRFNTPYLRDEQTIREFFDPLIEMAESGREKMIINFAGVESLASYSIGKLMTLNKKLAMPKVLALCELTPIVEELIDILGL